MCVCARAFLRSFIPGPLISSCGREGGRDGGMEGGWWARSKGSCV